MTIKVCLIGGGGVRTPLLIHGLAEAASTLHLHELALYDIDAARVELMAELGREVVREQQADFLITTHAHLEDAVAGASFILHSIRVGGIAARARDERLAIEHGIAGQETTGLAGFAKALRTIPVVLEQARIIEQHAPAAWFISFTNPAGLMAQAIQQHTRLRSIGICDTPSEMFYRLANALQEPLADVRCDYLGLNHLGWIRRVLVRGQDVTERVLNDDTILRSLYHAELFDPAMIRALGLIPSEYLFFYYDQHRALANQRAAGASRGEEIVKLNADLFASLFHELKADRPAEARRIYRNYLQCRSGSYMKLEAEGGSALHESAAQEEDPFDAATGYHRIAMDVMLALTSNQPARLVLNVRNNGAIADLEDDDVVEVPCLIDQHGPQSLAMGALPSQVRGLVQSVKEYERLTIRAAVEQSETLAKQALLAYPLVGEWGLASELVAALKMAEFEI
ncbi:MAG TPA: 6-phospho-beta-glucosidase [Blastocatellia bacterium]|nr:6-phospho-beta-glucosidase [Blastocatellia bacterium]